MPRGIDFAGSFRSPDIPSPERIPVTAGKNTANTGQNPSGAGTDSGGGAANPSGAPPRKNDTSDRHIAAMITYCVLSAMSAETDATTAITASVTSPVVRGSHPIANWNCAPKSASAKPAT